MVKALKPLVPSQQMTNGNKSSQIPFLGILADPAKLWPRQFQFFYEFLIPSINVFASDLIAHAVVGTFLDSRTWVWYLISFLYSGTKKMRNLASLFSLLPTIRSGFFIWMLQSVIEYLIFLFSLEKLDSLFIFPLIYIGGAKSFAQLTVYNCSYPLIYIFIHK